MNKYLVQQMIAIFFLSFCSQGLSENPIALIQNGPIEGYTRTHNLTQAVDVFQGIPYAEPPIGNLRFRSPQPYNKTWLFPRATKSLGSPCLQNGLKGDTVFGSEDCLYLNVYKPSFARFESNLPVMLWIYGGGYDSGDGSEYGLYDGSYLASNYSVIIVTFNYRLNGLGFFALDSLRDEDPNHSTGNYGLQDQRLAMEWVQRNIRYFGGDPSQVTIFGESAGAFSVTWHLVSQKSKGLFSAAISESGNSYLPWFFQPYQNATHLYEYYSNYLGCPQNVSNQIDCLRSLPADKFFISSSTIDAIKKAHVDNTTLPAIVPDFGPPLFPSNVFNPVIDGSEYGLLDRPISLMERGEFIKVPLLIGGNKNEASVFLPSMADAIPGFVFPPTNDSLPIALQWILQSKDNTTAGLNLYSDEEFKSAGALEATVRTAHIVRDITFLCSNERVAAQFAAHSVPVYVYSFSFDLGEVDKVIHLGNFHASELPFVFQTWSSILEPVVPNFREMSDIISSRWTNFAKCHNPNTCPSSSSSSSSSSLKNNNTTFGDLPVWPVFTNTDRQYYVLELPPTIQQLQSDNVYPNDAYPSDQKCSFWADQVFPWHDLRSYN